MDDDSPASHSGIRAGDRIIEVNGTNISNENHQQVVQRIKAVPNETKLLLVDRQTDDYYRSKKIVIRGDMPNVHRIEGPGSRDSVDGGGPRGSRTSSASSNHSGRYLWLYITVKFVIRGHGLMWCTHSRGTTFIFYVQIP